MKPGLRRKRRSGAERYVAVMQLAALLAGVYLLVIPGYPALLTHRSPLSAVFLLGMSALPRWEAAALSLLYRLTTSEVAVFFGMVGGALAFGLAAGRLLSSERTARPARVILAALIAAELVLRLLPLRWNAVFPLPYAIAGFVLRLGCLVLVLRDLRVSSKTDAST